MKYFPRLLGALALSMLPSVTATCSRTPVTTELLLLVDVSGSVDGTEFDLQRQGIADAFKDTDVQASVTTNPIAATLVYWSEDQEQAVAWTKIDSASSANAFASDVENAERPGGIGLSTAMADAINYAVPLFGCDYVGDSKTIDISGDGPDNVASGCSDSTATCDALKDKRDDAKAAGITINALFIGNQFPSSDPVAYAQTNVLTSAPLQGFVVTVSGFADFAGAILEKILIEISVEAKCADRTVEADEHCMGCADINDGSIGAEPLTFVQTPPCDYSLGDTLVVLTVTDANDNSDTCDATVTVVDVTPPTIDCDSPETIIPPDAGPHFCFAPNVDDNCGATYEIQSYDCWWYNPAGKRVDKRKSCVVQIKDDGQKICIIDSGGVGDNISWKVFARDDSGNVSEMTCALEVLKPGRGKGPKRYLRSDGNYQ